MNNKQKITLILFHIVLAVSIAFFIIEESNKQLEGAEKRIYNIYKSEEKAVSTNMQNLSDTKNISVMSYNIHRGKDYEDKYTLEEMINFLEESNADIICLQEVLFSQHTLIREHGNYKSQFVANIDIPIAATGLATYSKYPIVESNHIVLTSKTEQRGALHTVYKIDGKLLNVINVHLGLDKKERIKQVEELKNYVKKLDGDVLIAGDFNQDPLEIDGFVDVGKYHGYSEKNTFMPKDVRIDYIFMSNDEIYSTTYNNLTDINLSDHYPIMANIKYKPKITIKDDWFNQYDEKTVKEYWFKQKRAIN